MAAGNILLEFFYLSFEDFKAELDIVVQIFKRCNTVFFIT